MTRDEADKALEISERMKALLKQVRQDARMPRRDAEMADRRRADLHRQLARRPGL